MLLVHVLELSEFVDFKLKILQTPMRPLLEHCWGVLQKMSARAKATATHTINQNSIHI